MTLKKEQGFAHLLAVIVVGVFGFLTISSLVPINRHYNDGKSSVAGVYLAKGGDDSSSGSSNSGSGSDNSGSSQTSSNSVSSTPKPIKVEKIEVKTTPEKVKSEIRQGNLRFKFEVEDGKVKIETKVKKEDDEVELEDGAEDEALEGLEAELEKEDINIATAPGQIAFVNKRVGALTNFPLSVDPTTRQLTVTTPKGVKVVTVLPQKAVDNMLASKVMDDVVGEKVDNDLASIPDLVKLEIKNDVLGYKIKGTKLHKLFGLIPITTRVESFVSAENGQVVETDESLLGKILNRIAPL